MHISYYVVNKVTWIFCSYTSIEMYMCRYVIYKCVAHTSPGLFSSDPVSILRCLVVLFLGVPVSMLRCVSLPWWSFQCSEVVAHTTSTALCSEFVRRKAPKHILWWSNLYKFKPQIVLSCMCVVTTNTRKRVYSVVKIANNYCPQDVPWFCDNLTAKFCISSISSNVEVFTQQHTSHHIITRLQ